MLRNKKRVRADSEEITVHAVPLPPRAQPVRPAEYSFQPTPPLPKDSTQGSEEAELVDSEDVPEEVEQTRRAKVAEQYGNKVDNIVNLLLSQHADSRIGTPCSCQKGVRKVRCRDCFQRPPLCTECFIRDHKYVPFHWAEKWDEEGKFFSTCDLSALDPGWSLYLGHSAEPCPNPTQTMHLNVVETGGPHGTLVRYCQCHGKPDKWQQLFDAHLFPGSVKDPSTVYTFRLMREYEVHSVASKKNARDYAKALAQLTNRQFPEQVPFLFIARLWSYLKTKVWLGQGHGIDTFLPRRPAGNLRVYCPACPEEDLNLEEGWDRTPSELSHVYGSRKTLDGNHQLSHFEKNHDKNDVSWYKGNAYFPSHSAEKEYLEKVPQLQKARSKGAKGGLSKEGLEAIKEKLEKQVCGYLNVLAGQDKKKFRGMDVSGVVALLCDHVFNWAVVDMQYGERFSNGDLALAEGLKQRNFDQGKVPTQTLSYDCQCKYCRHLIERMLKAFPSLGHLLHDFRFTIPAVHVRNHLAVCMWLFAAAFKACTGRFHGETAEQIWAEFNLLGAATRQMSMGHRQDTIIQSLTGWNLRKFVQIAAQLEKDCSDALKNYYESRDNLVALYSIHREHLKKWLEMDRSPQVNGTTKLTVWSVYNHNTTGVLTYQQVMDRLVKSEKRISVANWWVAESDVARWLREALLVEDAEADLKQKEKGWTSFGRIADEKMKADMDLAAEKLEQRRVVLCNHQRLLFPMIADDVVQVGDSQDKSTVYVPSILPGAVRDEFGLEGVSKLEVECRTRLAVQCVIHVQEAIRNLDALGQYKDINDRGQEQNTQSTRIMNSYKRLRDALIEDYGRHRAALISLDALSAGSSDLPPLTLKDTYRKSTLSTRAAGSSRHRDGSLWIAGGYSSIIQGEARARAVESGESGEGSSSDVAQGSSAAVNTQMSRRQAAKRSKPNGPRKDEKSPIKVAEPWKEGWIWQRNVIMDQTEDEWAKEQERVKFFRDEADMERWQEQVEIKHAEFARIIRAFQKYKEIWSALAVSSSCITPGHTAYANKVAARYVLMEVDARARFKACGIPILREVEEGRTLADQILVWRAQEAQRFPQVNYVRPPFVDPTCSILDHKELNPDSSDEDV